MIKENVMLKVMDALLMGEILDDKTAKDFVNLSFVQIISGLNNYYCEKINGKNIINGNEYRLGQAIQGTLKKDVKGREYTGLEALDDMLNHITNHDLIPRNALLNGMELFEEKCRAAH